MTLAVRKEITMNQAKKTVAESGAPDRLEQLQAAVSAEYKAYKRKLCTMPADHVFQQTYHIHLVEEMTFVIRDFPEDIEDDEEVLVVLEHLTTKKQILSAFLDWADNDDYVNVSNAEKTAATLREFCVWWQAEQKGGAEQ
jgi:hypothetical protein